MARWPRGCSGRRGSYPCRLRHLRTGWSRSDDGRITWVGRAGASGSPEGALTDLGDGVLAPGLVNAHCHLELSHLAGRLPRVRVRALGRGARRRARPRAAGRGPRARAGGDPGAAGDGHRRGRRRVERARSPRPAPGFAGSGPSSSSSCSGGTPRGRSRRWRRPRRRLARARRPGSTARVRVRLAAHAPHSVSPSCSRCCGRGAGPRRSTWRNPPRKRRSWPRAAASGARSWSAAASAPWRSSLRA